MKIAKNSYDLKKVTYRNTHLSVICTKNYLIIEDQRYTAILEGTLYRIKNKLCNQLSKDSLIKELKTLLSESIDMFVSNIEGIYFATINDKSNDNVYVFRSATISFDIYYGTNSSEYLVSDSIKDLYGNKELDSNSLACILTEGYCPDRHTMYSGIYRLATDEYLTISSNGVEKNNREIKPIKINNDLTLKNYYDTFNNSIKSRASESNIVEISGGWDSTTVLGSLCNLKCHGIQALTTSITLPNGLNFNKYEVDKATEIAKFYDVPLTIVNYDMNNSNLIEAFHSNIENIRDHHIFDVQAIWRPVMYNAVKSNLNDEATCFNSLFSDSIHNFSFSQFVAVIDNDYVFREMIDKMGTYLYGPTFYNRILDDSFSNDFIYRMFKWHSKFTENEIFKCQSQTDKINKYLLSFVYGRNKSVPFSKPLIYEFLTENGKNDFERFLIDSYISPLSSLLNGGNIYFVLLELYKHFYLQGSEQKQVLYSLDSKGIKPASPFLDNDLISIAAQMPESWGRGVNSWNNTKYPIKKYAATQIKFPHEILSNSKYHAYLHEDKEHLNLNINTELLYNSVFAKELFNHIDAGSIDRLFNGVYFNLNKIKKLLSDRSDSSALKRRLLIFLAAMGKR